MRDFYRYCDELYNRNAFGYLNKEDREPGIESRFTTNLPCALCDKLLC
jgi:hypothetical protein